MKSLDQLNIPANLKYSQDHEWMSSGPVCRVGVSDYAQDQLGDLTYVELPEVGAKIAKDAEFGTLESSKSVSPLLLPVDGVIRAVNEALADDPGLVNRDPYGEGWIVEIELTQPGQALTLFEAGDYKDYLASL